MKIKFLLLLLSIAFFAIFTFVSYTVAQEFWQSIDFDTTVKLQDRIPRNFDTFFSYFSLFGSVEVTVGIAAIFSFLSLIRFKMFSFLGWLMIIPATLGEIFGKLVLFHPAPPVLLHRSILETTLPSFYVQTNFSYPSGHMLRTAFLVTIFLVIILSSRLNISLKFMVVFSMLTFTLMMFLTRIYLGEHWLSDVLGGGFLGSAFGLLSSSLILSIKKK